MVLAGGASRRGLLRLLGALPIAGLAGLLGDEDGLAGRRRRRKARRRRKNDRARKRKRQRNQKGKGKGPGPGNPTCTQACPPCQACDATSGQCAPDATQLGAACGELNQVCQGVGSCETCDVCASGCTYSSVQAAIDAASNGATIHVCAGTFSGNITIGKSLTLVGPGAGATTLSGNQNGSAVTVNQGPTVTLQGLRISNGAAINGGGINNSGTLTLTACTLTQNSADQGGGIYNSASLTLNQTSIEGNFALNNEGGGIYNGNGGNLVMNDSQISGNKAGQAGGGLFNNSAQATLNNSTITGNTATGQNGNPGQGGGIYNLIGTITLGSGSSVTGNNPDNCAGETVSGCSG